MLCSLGVDRLFRAHAHALPQGLDSLDVVDDAAPLVADWKVAVCSWRSLNRFSRVAFGGGGQPLVFLGQPVGWI